MFYVLTIGTAILLVTGQALWKSAITDTGIQLSLKTIFSSEMLSILLSPKLVLGVLIYFVATIAYIITLSRFRYSTTQGVIVSMSLILTFIIANQAFGERMNALSMAGVAALIVGVFLITRQV